jgi:hypothetical protein
MPALLAVSLSATAAHAGPEKSRGNIVSTDWGRMEMDIKDPQGRVATWKVARDCEVKFSDKKSEFPNPKLQDLRAPMYVHFIFEGMTSVIESIEVVEVGFEPSKGGPGVERTGTITNLDLEKGHVEVDLGLGPQTFEVEPKQQLAGLGKGHRVTVLIERREGREIVTRIRRVDSDPPRPGARRRP